MIGFIFLSICLAIPIGIVAFLAEESQSFARFIAFVVLIFAVIKKHEKVVVLLIVELVIDWALEQQQEKQQATDVKNRQQARLIRVIEKGLPRDA